jgi:hypothetical protein
MAAPCGNEHLLQHRQDQAHIGFIADDDDFRAPVNNTGPRLGLDALA